MNTTLETYVRQRAAQQGLSLSALCRRAGISRHTLYELAEVPRKLPSLATVVALAQALEVHPLRLLQCTFDLLPIKPALQRGVAGDRSAFVDDVTYPDGAVVAAGQRFEKVWRLQNVGTVPWAGRSLVCRDETVALFDSESGRALVSPGLRPDLRQLPLPTVAPGGMLDVALWFTAPTQPSTAISYWKMVDTDGALCFPEATGLWLMVKVVGVGTSAAPSVAKSL